MKHNDKENTDAETVKSKPGFLKLALGLFGVFLTYWAAKNAFIHTVMFMATTSNKPDLPPDILGKMSFPIVGYILVALFGLFVIRKSFKKVNNAE